MFGFFAKKTGMTTLIKKYVALVVTVLDISDNKIVEKRELPEGKKVVIIGVGQKKKPNKAELGKYKDLGFVPEKVKQFEVSPELWDKLNVGDTITKEFIEKFFSNKQESTDTSNVENNKKQDNLVVDITGISKGKGFAGVIKRWGFHRQPKTHGQSDRERHPGSIGAQTPGRVLKGKKMPGKMGNKQVTIKKVPVIDIVEQDNKTYMVIKGSVPGAYKNYVVVKIIK